MKKINKYLRKSETPSIEEGLNFYKKIATAIRRDKHNVSARKSSPLAMILPFAAASLTPFAIQAQCVGAAQIMTGAGDGNDINVDIDSDGTPEFFIQAQGNDLFVHPLTPDAEVNAVFTGGYYNAVNFANSAGISSGANIWVGAATDNYLTMAYQPGSYGQWAPTGSGFVGVRINGNQLGFIQVGWNGSAATVGLAGVQSAASAGETTITAGDCNSLPVELTRFEGTMFSDHAELQWTTVSEEDNKGFEIQSSRDGKNFKTIGFVEGQGYSSSEIDYTFNDDKIRKGVDYYYRLVQLDFWGKSTASQVINLKAIKGTGIQLNVSPNPASEFINVDYQSQGNSSAELTVFNANGQQVISQTLDSDSKANFQLNIEQLPAGSYFLKVEDAGEVEYRKFIKA